MDLMAKQAAFISVRRNKSVCCAVGCSNSQAKIADISMYSFPNEIMHLERRLKWIQAVNRITADNKPWQPTKNSKICSVHFVGGKKVDSQDSPSYLPTLFPPQCKRVMKRSAKKCRQISGNMTTSLPEQVCDVVSDKQEAPEQHQTQQQQMQQHQTQQHQTQQHQTQQQHISNKMQMEQWIYDQNEAINTELHAQTDPLETNIDFSTLKQEPSESVEIESVFIKEEPASLAATSVSQSALSDPFELDRLACNEEDNQLSCVKTESVDVKQELSASIQATTLVSDTNTDNDTILENPMMAERVAEITDMDLVAKFQLKQCYVPLQRVSESCNPAVGNDSSKLTSPKYTYRKSGDRFICNECGKSYVIKRYVVKHIATHEKRYQCDICLVVFITDDNLQTHKQKHENSLKCDYCNKIYTTRSRYLEHIDTHTKPFTCKLCKKAFSTKRRLKLHTVHVHLGQRSFRCDICDRSFTSKDGHAAHLQTHTKPFECDECKKRFGSKYSITNHIMLFHLAKPIFKCKICKKSYYSSKRLHMLTHSKPNKCDICGKSYALKTSVEHHLRKVHLRIGLRDFKCDVCDHFSLTKHCLDIHMRIHTKPFRCDQCGIGYSNVHSLEAHVTREHSK